jgi:hypothetical protein
MRTAKNGRLKGRVICIALGMACIAALAGSARGVQVSVRDTSGTAGDTVDVRITTTDLTGLDVRSYEFGLTYGATNLTLLDVIEAGSVSEPWGDVVFNSGSGAAQVAAAGIEPLAGAGDLLYLRFLLGPGVGPSWIYFDGFLFNEGAPEDTTDDGYVSISAVPTIYISPNSGEIAVGDSLQFSVSGGTQPYTWGSTDPAVGYMASNGMLHGASPGACRVFVVDNDGIADTTTDDIIVRAMKLYVPTNLSASPGDTFDIPVLVTDISGLGIRSLEFDMEFDPAVFEVLGASAVGTLTESWGAPLISIDPGAVSVAAAGFDELTGSGPVVYLNSRVFPGATGYSHIYLIYGLFDEVYVPLLVNGFLSIVQPPTIFITPETAELLVGDTRVFTVGGSPTPPFDWGTTDAGVGTMDSLGTFLAVGGGVCSVYVEDAASATDISGPIQVYDLLIYAPHDSVGIGDPPEGVPIYVDRDITGLGIRAYEITVSFNSSFVHPVSVTDSGSLSDPWGAPVYRLFDDSVKVVHANPDPLAGIGPLFHIYFEDGPGAYAGDLSYLNVTNAYLNEGDPIADTQNGDIRLIDPLAGTLPYEGSSTGFMLEQNRPNPFSPMTTIRFAVPEPCEVNLSVHDVKGNRIAMLYAGYCESGRHERAWDGRDRDGRSIAPGIYFIRMEAPGFTDTRKMILLR